MYRTSRNPIAVPQGIKAVLLNEGSDTYLALSSGQNTLKRRVHPFVDVALDEQGSICVKQADKVDKVQAKMQIGTLCAHILNMITGLSKGHSIPLVIAGTGYKAELKGQDLVMRLGYSQDKIVKVPENIKVELPTPLEMNVSSEDKEALGAFVDMLLNIRPLDVYHLKGVMRKDRKYVKKEVRKS